MTHSLSRALPLFVSTLLVTSIAWAQSAAPTPSSRGSADLPASCHEGVRDGFDRGVILLHSLWTEAAGPILPARLLLGDLLLATEQPAPALAEFETYLRAHPDRFRALDGAARTAELAGDRARAGQDATQLLKLAEHADTERPEIARAKALLSSTGSALPRQ